jgi:hypothetical protein
MSLQERKSYLEKVWEAVVGEGIGPNGDSEIYSEQNLNNEGAEVGDEHFEMVPDAQDLASLNHLLKMESRTSNKHLKGRSGLLKTNDLQTLDLGIPSLRKDRSFLLPERSLDTEQA